MVILVNEPPRGGNFAVVPNEGETGSTLFQLQANLWSDSDLPLAYLYEVWGTFYAIYLTLPRPTSQAVGTIQ